jgi:hypothetical protein
MGYHRAVPRQRDAGDKRRHLWEWPRVIGWNEYVDLPDWGIRRLRAKADTGARTSALHVEEIEIRPRGRVVFRVVLSRRRPRRVRVETRITRRARVRSSTGHYEERLFVTARLRVGPVERDVELSLVDRERMIYRMLLGRTAIHGLLVDPSHANLLTPSARERRARPGKRRS